MIAVDFYVERRAFPDSIVYTVAEAEGEIEEHLEGQGPGERTLERQAQVGLLLSPRVASAIGVWLVQQAAALDESLADVLAEEPDEAEDEGDDTNG
jgi:hypothetical protein